MLKGKIKWSVHDFRQTTDFVDGKEFKATIIGKPDPIFCGDWQEVRNHILATLNQPQEMDKSDPFVDYIVTGRRNGKTLIQMNPYEAMLHGYKNGPVIKNVIFNEPATIVFWSDDTKTVVKCQDGDVYDPEKGLAMAIVKKSLGNKGNYCNQLKPWLDKYEEEQKADCVFDFELALQKFRDYRSNLNRKRVVENEKYRESIKNAYRVLRLALADPKSLKGELIEAMEEAVGYLGEALDE